MRDPVEHRDGAPLPRVAAAGVPDVHHGGALLVPPARSPSASRLVAPPETRAIKPPSLELPARRAAAPPSRLSGSREKEERENNRRGETEEAIQVSGEDMALGWVRVGSSVHHLMPVAELADFDA
nr:unnamed protein product [Digitaria exilis]